MQQWGQQLRSLTMGWNACSTFQIFLLYFGRQNENVMARRKLQLPTASCRFVRNTCGSWNLKLQRLQKLSNLPIYIWGPKTSKKVGFFFCKVPNHRRETTENMMRPHASQLFYSRCGQQFQTPNLGSGASLWVPLPQSLVFPITQMKCCSCRTFKATFPLIRVCYETTHFSPLLIQAITLPIGERSADPDCWSWCERPFHELLYLAREEQYPFPRRIRDCHQWVLIAAIMEGTPFWSTKAENVCLLVCAGTYSFSMKCSRVCVFWGTRTQHITIRSDNTGCCLNETHELNLVHKSQNVPFWRSSNRPHLSNLSGSHAGFHLFHTNENLIWCFLWQMTQNETRGFPFFASFGVQSLKDCEEKCSRFGSFWSYRIWKSSKDSTSVNSFNEMVPQVVRGKLWKTSCAFCQQFPFGATHPILSECINQNVTIPMILQLKATPKVLMPERAHPANLRDDDAGCCTDRICLKQYSEMSNRILKC